MRRVRPILVLLMFAAAVSFAQAPGKEQRPPARERGESAAAADPNAKPAPAASGPSDRPTSRPAGFDGGAPRRAGCPEGPMPPGGPEGPPPPPGGWPGGRPPWSGHHAPHGYGSPEGGLGMGPGGLPMPPPPFPMLRIIAERRPELAARLENLMRNSPEKFEEVLAKALMFQLESALNDVDDEPAPRDGKHPVPPGEPGPGPDQRSHEAQAKMRELIEKQDQLELQSRTLAEKLRATGLSDADKQSLREELRRTIEEQFEVRSTLRQHELERLQKEIERLQAGVARVQAELDKRGKEKEAIIKHRVEQLLGDAASGW